MLDVYKVVLCATEQSETKRSYENKNESINFNHL